MARFIHSVRICPSAPFRGWILFDAECGLCFTLRDRWGPTVEPRGFRLAALQEPWVQRRLRLRGTIPEELKLLTPQGRVLGGADALLFIAHYVWWAWPFWLVGRWRPIRAVLRALYRPIARHRHAISRACRLRPVPGPALSTDPHDRRLPPAEPPSNRQ